MDAAATGSAMEENATEGRTTFTGGDRMSLCNPTHPLLRVPRVVVPCDVLQRFLAGRLVRPDSNSSSNSSNNNSNLSSRHGYVDAPLHENPLIVSWHLSLLSKSRVRQLRRDYYQVMVSKAPTTGGVATACPLAGGSERTFHDSNPEEEGTWEDVERREGEEERGVGREKEDRYGEENEAASNEREGELRLFDGGGKEEKAETPELEVNRACIQLEDQMLLTSAHFDKVFASLGGAASIVTKTFPQGTEQGEEPGEQGEESGKLAEDQELEEHGVAICEVEVAPRLAHVASRTPETGQISQSPTSSYNGDCDKEDRMAAIRDKSRVPQLVEIREEGVPQVVEIRENEERVVVEKEVIPEDQLEKPYENKRTKESRVKLKITRSMMTRRATSRVCEKVKEAVKAARKSSRVASEQPEKKAGKVTEMRQSDGDGVVKPSRLASARKAKADTGAKDLGCTPKMSEDQSNSCRRKRKLSQDKSHASGKTEPSSDLSHSTRKRRSSQDKSVVSGIREPSNDLSRSSRKRRPSQDKSHTEPSKDKGRISRKREPDKSHTPKSSIERSRTPRKKEPSKSHTPKKREKNHSPQKEPSKNHTPKKKEPSKSHTSKKREPSVTRKRKQTVISEKIPSPGSDERGRLGSAEDSGYPHSLSSSDRNPFSASPNLTSPVTPMDPVLTFDVSDSCMNQDPNLHSNMTPGLHCLSDAKLTTVGMENEACLPCAQVSPGRREGVCGDGIIFPELEENAFGGSYHLPEAMFEPRDLVVYEARGERCGEGVTPYSDYCMEAFLDPEGINEWFRQCDESQPTLEMCGIDVDKLYDSILSVDGATTANKTPPPTAAPISSEPILSVGNVVTVASDEVKPIDMDTPTLTKRKRGRPRKPPSSEQEVPQVPKRRGRPKRSPLLCDPSDVANDLTVETEPATQSPPLPLPPAKRRGRLPRKRTRSPSPSRQSPVDPLEDQLAKRLKVSEQEQVAKSIAMAEQQERSSMQKPRKKSTIPVSVYTQRSKSGRVCRPSWKVVSEWARQAFTEGRARGGRSRESSVSEKSPEPLSVQNTEVSVPVTLPVLSQFSEENAQELDALWRSPIDSPAPLPALNMSASSIGDMVDSGQELLEAPPTSEAKEEPISETTLIPEGSEESVMETTPTPEATPIPEGQAEELVAAKNTPTLVREAAASSETLPTQSQLLMAEITPPSEDILPLDLCEKGEELAPSTVDNKSVLVKEGEEPTLSYCDSLEDVLDSLLSQDDGGGVSPLMLDSDRHLTQGEDETHRDGDGHLMQGDDGTHKNEGGRHVANKARQKESDGASEEAGGEEGGGSNGVSGDGECGYEENVIGTRNDAVLTEMVGVAMKEREERPEMTTGTCNGELADDNIVSGKVSCREEAVGEIVGERMENRNVVSDAKNVRCEQNASGSSSTVSLEIPIQDVRIHLQRCPLAYQVSCRPGSSIDQSSAPSEGSGQSTHGSEESARSAQPASTVPHSSSPPLQLTPPPLPIQPSESFQLASPPKSPLPICTSPPDPPELTSPPDSVHRPPSSTSTESAVLELEPLHLSLSPEQHNDPLHDPTSASPDSPSSFPRVPAGLQTPPRQPLRSSRFSSEPLEDDHFPMDMDLQTPSPQPADIKQETLVLSSGNAQTGGELSLETLEDCLDTLNFDPPTSVKSTPTKPLFATPTKKLPSTPTRASPPTPHSAYATPTKSCPRGKVSRVRVVRKVKRKLKQSATSDATIPNTRTGSKCSISTFTSEPATENGITPPSLVSTLDPAAGSSAAAPSAVKEDVEDCIDLHATDEDMFDVDPDEMTDTPLDRIFPRLKKPSDTTPPTDPPPPLLQQKPALSNQMPAFALKKSDAAPSTDGPQPLFPGLSNQKPVFSYQCPAESRPQPPLLGIHPLGSPGPPKFLGGLMSRHARLQAARQAALNQSDSILPTPGFPGPFVSTPLPLSAPSSLGSPCSSTSSQEGVATATQSTLTVTRSARYCNMFLLQGRCSYTHCRFQHVSLPTIPLPALQEVLLTLSPEAVPTEPVCRRFTANSHSCAKLCSQFLPFVAMLRNMQYGSTEAVAAGYHCLVSCGVQFNASFLCHMLSGCGSASAGVVGSPQHRFRRALVEGLESIQYQLSVDDYALVFRTLTQLRLFEDVKTVYGMMKLRHMKPSLTVLSTLLRCGRDLGEWTFLLLEDFQLCDQNSESKESSALGQFLQTVDTKLLLRRPNLTRVAQYLASPSSSTAAARFSVEAFTRLCHAFSSCNMWEPLLTLFQRCLRLLPSTRTAVCQPLESAIRHLGLSEKMMATLERLTDEQKAGLSDQIWDQVMLTCAKQGRSQRATKFYAALTKCSRQLSDSTMLALMELFSKQHNPTFAATLLRDSLRHTPPLAPPLSLLHSLTPTLETVASSQDLFLLITTLLRASTTPPASIMQSLLRDCCRDKCYSRLAEVVKLARDGDVVLEKAFYSRVSKELGPWGEDQEALAEVTKQLAACGRKGKPRATDTTIITRAQPSPSAAKRRKLVLPLQSSSSSQPPPPPVESRAEPTSSVLTAETSPATSECSPVHNEAPPLHSPTLEDVMEQGTSQDIRQLLQLIEMNGKLGQFGAVASILVSMDSSTSHQYSMDVVLSIWKAIAGCSLRKANAFSSFLTHLNQCRYLAANNRQLTSTQGQASTPICLLASDQWVVSQLGVALMRLCEGRKEWNSGYVVLHHLHRFGVHYVRLSQPPSLLPPLLPSPPSPCAVATTAINLCLHLEKETHSAVEVMKGCDWVGPANEAERGYYTEILATLAQRCLAEQMLEEAWLCLQAVTRGKVPSKFVHPVTNLHNKALQGILDSSNHQLALTVFESMKKAGLQCLPSVFSTLLQTLSDKGQVSQAQELCRTAIEDNCYAPLVKSDVFDVTLPVGLVRLEMQLLLEDCLQKLIPQVHSGSTKPLTIHLSAGCRDTLEQVVTKDISPPLLGAKFESKLVTISSTVLRHWFNARPKGESSRPTVKESNVETSDCQPGDSELGGGERGGSLSAKQLLKIQKAAVCREFAENMKPHYKTLFSSKEDYYAQLLKDLAKTFLESSQTFSSACLENSQLSEKGQWEVPEALKQEVKTVVSNALAKLSVTNNSIKDK